MSPTIDLLCTVTCCCGLLAVAGMLSVAPVMAAYLTLPESLSVEAGEHLLHPLPAVDPRGARVQIALGEAPSDARLAVDDDGQLLLDWQTTPELSEQSRIEILLSNIDTGKLLEGRQVMVRRVELSLISSNPSEPERARASDAMPRLGKLANQVVSPGFVVSLRVDATLPDTTAAILQVDRLPRRASFEAGENGSRTFYWRTDNQDEGEHVFRFTAVNPLNADLRTSQEVMIVVGSPTKSTTRPAPAAPANQP